MENLNLIERNRSWLEFQKLLYRALEKIKMLKQPDTDTQWCDEHEPDYIVSLCNLLNKRMTQHSESIVSYVENGNEITSVM